MRKLFIPLLAAIALPTAVNADVAPAYLIIKTDATTSTVPMKSMEACARAEEKALVKDNWKRNGHAPCCVRAICLKSE